MSALFEIPYTITLPERGEVDAIVHAKFHEGRPGRNYMPNGDPGYPDDPPEVEVIAVMYNGIDYVNVVGEALSENDSFCEKVSKLYAESLMPPED